MCCDKGPATTSANHVRSSGARMVMMPWPLYAIIYESLAKGQPGNRHNHGQGNLFFKKIIPEVAITEGPRSMALPVEGQRVTHSWGGSISTDCMLCPLAKLIHSYHVDFSELHLYIPNCPPSTYNSVNPQHPQLSTYKLDSVFIYSSPQTPLTLIFFPFLRR